MPRLWLVPLPGEKSNPGSRQDIHRFPIPAPCFGQIPDPENTLLDPCITPNNYDLKLIRSSGLLTTIDLFMCSNKYGSTLNSTIKLELSLE